MMYGKNIRPIIVYDLVDNSVPSLNQLPQVSSFEFGYQAPDMDLLF